ncbi:MAG: hypothetical protein HY904_03640 [Deltaproteobacteria bacterium]|nr:hypothetical protein [Deltaproteobacteria bacterium]
MRVLVIARATFREGVRSQVFVNLAVFAVFAVGMALLLEGLTIGEKGRTLRDTALALLSGVNALLAVMMAVQSMGGADDRRMLLTVLVRPVTRMQLMAGKFLGLSALLWVNTLLAGLLLRLAVAVSDAPGAGLLVPLLGLGAEAALVVAATLVFTAFAGTTVAAVCGLATWLVGLGGDELRRYAETQGEAALAWMLRLAAWAMPNLQRLDFNAHPLDASRTALVLADAVVHAVALVLVAGIVFERRDLK